MAAISGVTDEDTECPVLVGPGDLIFADVSIFFVEKRKIEFLILGPKFVESSQNVVKKT